MRSSVQKAVLVVLAATALAGLLRGYRLGSPPEKVFDEVYYASDGCWYTGEDYRNCGLDADVERSWVHPPLGKTMIAWGIDIFGNRPLGWRASAALAGTLTVAFVGALAFVLAGSWVWAGVAALLLATENLHFVQSRIAMLDVFLAMFVVLGFLLLVADRKRTDPGDVLKTPAPEGPGGMPEEEISEGEGRARGSDEGIPTGPSHRGLRPLRLAAGAALGAAVAVKWSGVLALAAAPVLALAWERTRRKRSGAARPLLRALREEWLGIVLAFLVVPFIVYAAAWIPWLQDRGFSFGEWFRHHRFMAEYHFNLSTIGEDGKPIHPYMSEAWTWFLLLRPVAYFWHGTDRTGAEILGIGHPLLFWGALLVIPYLALAWWSSRAWRAGAILVPILAQYVPWLIVQRPAFLFYLTPVTPFLALGTTYLLRDLAGLRFRKQWASPVTAAVVIVAIVGVFAYFWPVLVGQTIDLEAW
ncbi:MAG TPA: phospholipid carrier-dependent glycosyltransferase, partial [Actinomycetota bacterium]|nr:phospholipid carrier-dependent glycosyltransferase [Actinomycetota bacterium]